MSTRTTMRGAIVLVASRLRVGVIGGGWTGFVAAIAWFCHNNSVAKV